MMVLVDHMRNINTVIGSLLTGEWTDNSGARGGKATYEELKKTLTGTTLIGKMPNNPEHPLC